MIRVKGKIEMTVPFDIELHMSAEEFDEMSPLEQDILIAECVNWDSVLADSELNYLDVEELEEFKR